MRPHHFTIQAKAAEKIIWSAVQRGVEANDLYRAVKLEPSVLYDPDNRIPFHQIVELYEKAAELTSDNDFGLHLAENVHPTAFDVVGYAAINSATLGDAFARVARYNSIWTDGSSFTFDSTAEPPFLAYKYLDRSISQHRQDAEMTFAMIAVFSRRIAPEFSPVAIEFQHDAPEDLTEHRRIFDCPVKFRASVNRLYFEPSSLWLPIERADPGLCALLDRHAEELLAKYPPRDSLVSEVRNIIANEFKRGYPSVENVASQVGITSRTLQRKLREAGTSHNELLHEMRQQLAIDYLREPEIAICEVAYLLGFSETSSFHRAFKRWTGRTPKEFRTM
jgi:AraC-like DNA-binding protein